MTVIDVPGIRGYEVRLIDSFSDADFEAFSKAYERLVMYSGRSLAACPGHFRLKALYWPDTKGPFILLLLKAGRPVGLAVARISAEAIAMRSGVALLPRPRRYCLTVPEDGFMVEEGSYEHADALMRALRHSLGLGAFTVLRLLWVPRGSLVFQLAMRSRPRALRAVLPITSEHWFTDLGGSLDEMLAMRSKRHRGNLKRIIKKIENSPEKFMMREFRKLDEVPRFLEDSEQIVARTYQRHWNVGYVKDRATSEFVALAASEGRLLGYVLYAEGRPCAFQLGISYGEIHTILYIAHDPTYAYCDPGIYLILKSLDSLCRDGNVKVVDYGWGDGEHKRRFGNRSRLESNIVFFAPTFGGFLLCFWMSLSRIVSRIVKTLMVIFGIHKVQRKLEKTVNEKLPS